MGVHDVLIFPQYINFFQSNIEENNEIKNIAFLGFQEDNIVTEFIKSCCTKLKNADYYDLCLNGWDINDDWKLKRKYDLIVCLRTAYFSKDPLLFLKKCHKSLNKGGNLFVDWGLGDHWRYKHFVVGWYHPNTGEREKAPYLDGEKSYLYSCFWDKLFERDPYTQWFFHHSSQHYGYDISKSFDTVLDEEIGSERIINIEKYTRNFVLRNIRLFAINTMRPQIYIMLYGIKR